MSDELFNELTKIVSNLLDPLPGYAELNTRAAFGPIQRVSVTRALHTDQEHLRLIALRVIALRDKLQIEKVKESLR